MTSKRYAFNVAKMAKEAGISEKTAYNRLYRGWSIRETFNTPQLPHGVRRNSKVGKKIIQEAKKSRRAAKEQVVATPQNKSDGIVASAALIAAVVAVLLFLFMQEG
jgi:hypothetical protein